jgi:hypothetical protein
MKLHKPNRPICPVNWCNTPTFKLAKFLSQTLEKTLQLPCMFNIKNSVAFMDDLKNYIHIDTDTRICSFDIKNMYTNIPTEEMYPIVTDILNAYSSPHLTFTHKLLKLLSTALSQNFFQFQPDCYEQKTGLAMGSPTSAIISEVFFAICRTRGNHPYIKITHHHHIL